MTSQRRSIFADRLLEFPAFTFVDDAAARHRGRWGEFFRERIGQTFHGRIVFEVGCFDAAYLARVARKHPRVGFVGIDWKYKALYEGARRVADQGLRNVALLRGRAQDLRQFFADGEIDEVWVFHPDPCDGPRQIQNRLMAEPFLLDVHPILRDETSTLTLKTDHPGYHQWVLGLFGVQEPAWFEVARASGPAYGDLSLPRVRWRDLVRADAVPGPNATLLARFGVASASHDYWADAALLARNAGRSFAGELTTFESRFIKKRLPIYFLEIRKKMVRGSD